MREFFLGQMDYIFYIYGLAFILLFSVCSSLQKQYKARIPWNFLGLFGRNERPLLFAAILEADDRILRHIHKAAREVAGVRGAERRVGQAFSGAVRRDEVFQNIDAFFE